MEKSDRQKVMILVTDGEDLEKSGVAMAQSLAQKDVVVHAIGVGTAGGSPIQIMNENGTSQPMRDAEGNIVVSHLDENTLSQIAQATHGSYAPLGPLGEGLSRVRHLVEASANAAEFSKARKLGVDRYYIPVALVIVLIVLESLIGTRRHPRQNPA
jgi:Ca-activated chloride channel family protein